MITRTPALYNALLDVARREIDFYPGLAGGHPLGFAWHTGGDVPPSEQEALAALAVVRLVDTIPACVCGQIGCEVVLTRRGQELLSEWDEGERS